MANDPVNHPSHYTTGKIEVIDFIEDQKLGFHEANAVKYIARAKHKGRELEDLQKARWYLDRRIQQMEKRERTPCPNHGPDGYCSECSKVMRQIVSPVSEHRRFQCDHGPEVYCHHCSP